MTRRGSATRRKTAVLATPALLATLVALAAPVATAAPTKVDGSLPGHQAPPAEADRWRPDLESARAYATKRVGTISFAVRTPDRLYRSDAYRFHPSASVVKAMLMVAYLNHPSVRGRRLNRSDRELLAPMVRWSDNVAATLVRDFVGNGALEHLADRVGMVRFASAPSWGSTLVTAAGQSKLFLRIDRHVVRRHRGTALRLLRTIVPAQRWGIARAPHPGWSLHFKGGWGDGDGEVDHQVALLRRGERRLAIAIFTAANPSHAYGKQTLEGIARRLLRGLGPRSRPR